MTLYTNVYDHHGQLRRMVMAYHLKVTGEELRTNTPNKEPTGYGEAGRVILNA